MVTKTRVKRKEKGSSKAQAIRDEFHALGRKSRPKDVIASLAAKGIEVSSAQVSNVKATLGRGKPGRKGSAPANGTLSLEVLVETKKLADRLGGIDVARKVLDVLASLS